MADRSAAFGSRFGIQIMASLLVFLGVASARAQWVSQDVTLKPGWNAVYFSFQPAPAACGTFFSGVPVSSVAWWCRSVGDAEFQSDPSAPYPRSAHWRKWTPGDPDLSTFDALLAGEAYLIHLATNVNVTLHARGTAVLVPADWMHDEYNLVGFPVASASVTFGSLFSFTDRIKLDSVQQVLASGSVSAVFRPTSAPIEPGRAYWVLCGPQATDFAGPIRLALGTAAKRMDFSGAWHPQTLRIINDTAAPRSVTLRHLASEAPPDGVGTAPLAGKTPLLMEVADTSAGSLGAVYVPLPDTLVTNVPANAEVAIRLMPRVAALAGAPAGSAWQSILRVSDAGNPGAAVVSHQVGVTCDAPDAAALDPAGLWVGAVSVTGVSRAPTQAGVSNTWDATAPVAVTRPYTFRVLLHGDASANRQWRLLQRAYLVTDTNGTDRVFTDTVYAQHYAADHPECKIARLSTANLPLIDPLAMTNDGTNLSVTVTLPYDDPANPFVHPFHPQHDNKDARNGAASALPDGVESYTVTRTMNFAFAETDPVHPGNPDWNISESGGTFTEQVRGLNKTIYVRGSFRLERVSRAAALSYLSQTE
jgi:hypothetical protein